MRTIQIINKTSIPLLGLGVFQITNQNICEQTVLQALKTGYRMIDTAACYGNEKAVGNAIMKSNVKREEIYLISKVWIQDSGYENTKKSFNRTLENLRSEYLDLYLIHMPYGDYYGSWRAMEELYKEGKIKAIGVCNFLDNRLIDLILNCNIPPMVNQIELHPFCQQVDLRNTMKKYNVQPMAWAPFAEGKMGIFQNDTLINIGKKYDKSPAQVILRWLYQNDIIAIPKSIHKERIEENFNIHNFLLSDEDINQINKLDTKKSIILDINSTQETIRLNNIHFKQ